MNKGAIAIVALVVVGIVALVLYRSTSGEDFPDDEWFEFEVPEEV